MNRAGLMLPALLFVLSPFWAGCSIFSEKPKTTAVQHLTQFYASYLRTYGAKKVPRLRFSNNLNKLITENKKVCAEFAAGEPCGVQSIGDIYLNTQGHRLRMTLKQANFSATELESGQIEVNLDLSPPEKSSYHHRRILYDMVTEGGKWAVDDIVYENGSFKSHLLSEIREFRALSQ